MARTSDPGTAGTTIDTVRFCPLTGRERDLQPPPALTSFTPTSAYPGQTVTLTGTNFAGATCVLFNGVAAAFALSRNRGVRRSATRSDSSIWCHHGTNYHRDAARQLHHGEQLYVACISHAGGPPFVK